MAGNIGKQGNTLEVLKRIPKTKEKKETKEKPHYRIRLNIAHNPNIRFATLIHELAHLYLGHLGEDDYLKIPDRTGLSHDYKELEADPSAI